MNPFLDDHATNPFQDDTATSDPETSNAFRNDQREEDYFEDEQASSSKNKPEKILWSCISRNNVILAEAGQDCYGGAVTETARGLLRRQATPGYEFHSSGRKWRLTGLRGGRNTNTKQHVPTLRGCKFHIFEHDTEQVEKVRVWVFAAVYDSSLVSQLEVQSFIEKIVYLTEMYRNDETNVEWRTGGTLACQSSFAPILLQRMQEVTYLGKMAMITEKLDESKQIMEDNIDVIMEREDMLRDKLSQKSTALTEMATVFRKRSRKVRRMKMMQNAKHGIVMGTAVTAGVAIVVVPPLVAIL